MHLAHFEKEWKGQVGLGRGPLWGPAWDLSTLIDRPVGFVERGWKTMRQVFRTSMRMGRRGGDNEGFLFVHWHAGLLGTGDGTRKEMLEW